MSTTSAAGREGGGQHAPPDLAWLDPRLALGGRPYAAQRLAIRQLGFDSVIALEEPGPGEAAAWSALGVEYVAFPTRDWVGIPASRFDEVVDALFAGQAAGRTVLLACLAGINRSPTFAAAFLCRRDGLSVDEAVERVRAARPSASPTPEQLASLREWASRLR